MNGIIVINKEKGCTSHDVVYKIKKMFGEKVGHTGTLDPNATGVLPILIGKATGLSQYLINHNKKYIATIKLGEKTDTADVEGNVIEQKEVDENIFNSEKLNSVLQSIIGKQKQKPPIYSAIKINGKKLYEYARSGKTVDIPERNIEIYDMKLIEYNSKEKTIMFEVYCSKGTYIRTICETLAEKLGTVGYMKDLQRTMAGDFFIENSITISELEKINKNDIYSKKYFITIEDFFQEKPSLKLNQHQLNLLLNGVLIDCNINTDMIRIYNQNNNFIGTATTNNKKLKRNIIE